MKYILFILVFVFFTACTSKWEHSSTVLTKGKINLNENLREKEVHIFVFRESGFIGSATTWPIIYNKKEISKIKNGTYLLLKTNEGLKEFAAIANLIEPYKPDTPIFQISVKAGKKYYLKHGTKAITSSILEFIPQNTSLAKKELSSYSLVNIIDEYEKPILDELQCKYWNKTTGITDEDKAWAEIQKNLYTAQGALLNKGNKKLKSFDVDIKGIKFAPDKILTAVNVIGKINSGDYKGAAEDSANEAISYMLPIAGQYKAILDATKTSIDAVIENWIADLYLSGSYELLSKKIQKLLIDGMKKQDPFLPTLLIKRPSSLYNKMFKLEKQMYKDWKTSEIYYEEFYASQGASSFWSRLRQKLGKQPLDVEIFKHFYTKIVNDRKAYILHSFNESMEDKIFDEAYSTKPLIIENVCKKLEKISK